MVFPTTLRRSIIALNGVHGPDYYQAGDANMYPGMIVAYDDSDEVKICTYALKPIGVVGCDADHDLSTVYALGERIPIWLLGCGVDLYVKCSDSSTVERDDIIEMSDNTTLDGLGQRKVDYIVLTTANADTAGTERNMTTWFYIGRALEAGALTTAVSRYIPVKLSL